MGNRVFLNQDIIEIMVVGDQTVASVERMGRDTSRLLAEQRQAGKSCLVLDNVLEIGQVGVDARKLVVDLARRFDYDRLALLGKGSLLRLGANLMLRATGKAYKMRYFDDRAAALKWLHKI
ncbi:MAG TPA: STAS/SEC14 domain-containing protein [Bacillota bacterium]|nr:STAS/SEC14 domain-containing protein [Bacillota bacterium]